MCVKGFAQLNADPAANGSPRDSFRRTARIGIMPEMMLKLLTEPCDHQTLTQGAMVAFAALRQIDWDRIIALVQCPSISNKMINWRFVHACPLLNTNLIITFNVDRLLTSG